MYFCSDSEVLITFFDFVLVNVELVISVIFFFIILRVEYIFYDLNINCKYILLLFC